MTGFIKKGLDQLFGEIPLKIQYAGELPPLPVTGIAFDSREVLPGNIFIALSGANFDAHRFIPDAINKGAVAVVGTNEPEPMQAPYIQVSDAREALAHLSAAFYNFPARDLVVIGVTGTDGKTTTANLIYQILRSARIHTGIISTVNAVIGDEVEDTGFHVTTPEAPDVQRYLSRMVAAGLSHVVLEATSHGLAQHRVTGCAFDIALVTNITHEHLDYHGNYEAYRNAKGRLFEMVRDGCDDKTFRPCLAVLNRDDESFPYLWDITREINQVIYSINDSDVHIWAENLEYTPSGLRFVAVTREKRIPIVSHLIGEYNVSNILAALAATVVGSGISAEAAQRGIADLPGIPGRMERIDWGQDFIAVVDFAHTPNALTQTLKAARKMTQGKVIAVFGSAGLRDREKRRLMAEVSTRLADLTILTAEDPRTESLEDILSEMAAEAAEKGGEEGRSFWRVQDRGEAIRKAVSMAQPGDIVLACGKGHEQSMCFVETEYAWDDRTAMKCALAELMGKSGPDMPYLPTQKKNKSE